MGRVEEALRRAAEARKGSVEGSESPAEVLARQEQFPEETALHASDEFTPGEPGQGALTLPTHHLVDSGPTPPPDQDLPLDGSRASPGLLQRLNAGLARKVVIDQSMLPASREQYRRLAATLHHAQAANGVKVILVASAVAGEGKTLTTSNLALTFSESYQRSVLLIDADLRKPSQHAVFQVPASPGLTEGLSAIPERKLLLHQITPRLTLLPGGRSSGDPMAGLTSDRMRRLILEARESFDWVLIDTPPVGLLTDASLLASWVDAALIVIKAGSTPYPLVQRAVDALGRDRVIGAVLNRATVPPNHGSGYEYYGRYYQSTAPVG
jgi:capsular exopolysaccharide synthesis family protein